MSNSGQKSGKAPERANFVNLLSQCLKEKRNLGDISIGMISKREARGLETMNFLPKMDNSLESSKPKLVAYTTSVKSSDFFPEIASFGSSGHKEDTTNETDFRKPALVEPKNAPLTIIFGGRVLLYNDFPADKVKDIVALASLGCLAACNGGVADSGMEKVNSNLGKIDSTNSDIPDLNIASATATGPAQDPSVERRQYGGSDLGIARRNSLRKFFEKRRDRAAARAPYQVHNPRGPSPPPKPDGSKSSSDQKGQSLKEESRDLDLKL